MLVLCNYIYVQYTYIYVCVEFAHAKTKCAASLLSHHTHTHTNTFAHKTHSHARTHASNPPLYTFTPACQRADINSTELPHTIANAMYIFFLNLLTLEDVKKYMVYILALAAGWLMAGSCRLELERKRQPSRKNLQIFFLFFFPTYTSIYGVLFICSVCCTTLFFL